MRNDERTLENTVERFKAFYAIALRAMDGAIQNYQRSPSELLATEFAVRIQRQAEACCAISLALLAEEAFAYLRVPMEHLIHLLYIEYAGPAEEQRTADDLANQYYAYPEKSQLSFIQNHPEEAQRVFERRNMDQAAIDVHKARLQASVDQSGFQFGRSSWHPRSTETMASNIINHLPDFIGQSKYERFFEMMYPIFRLQSSRLHPSWVGHQMLERIDNGQRTMVDNRYLDENRGHSAIICAYFAWLVAADKIGIRPTIEAAWTQEMDTVDAPRVLVPVPQVLRLDEIGAN